MGATKSLLLLCVLSSSLLCQGSSDGEIDDRNDVSVAYLFSVGSDLADVMYRDRPTPVIAVRDGQFIAFPLRAEQIGIFTIDGELVDTIDSRVVPYPSQIAWGDNGIIFARDHVGSRFVDLATDGAEDFSVLGWLNATSPDVAADLRRSGFVLEAGATIGWDQDHVYVYQDLVLTSIRRGTYKRQPVVEAPLGDLLGAVGPRRFLFLNVTNECFLVSLRDADGVDRAPIESLAEDRPVVPQFTESVNPNYPETNKQNRRRGWYWDADHRKLYKVVHAPAGFHFFEYRFAR